MQLPSGRKVSTSLIILAACVLGVGVGLFGLNFWHAMRCSGNHDNPIDVEVNMEALNRRLLHAESQTIKNTIFMNKVIGALQDRLIQLESTELDALSKLSQDEAVRIALLLAAQPAPPMPEFEIEEKYKDPEELADLVDDLFGKAGDSSSTDFTDGYASEKEISPTISISDTEATKNCLEWREKYSVVKGVSWGNLPYDLQQKWVEYSCDYHLATDSVTEEAPAGETLT